MHEAEFIATLRKLPLHSGARGLEDDCALLEIGGETLIVTHDAMAEGTHWRAQADPFDIAWKLVAANLSDLAAKGAEPLGVLLGYTLKSDDLEGDEARFVEGLGSALAAFEVALLGGDTIAAQGPRQIGLTAIGRATHTPVPSRSGAKAGDHIYVTGTLGQAMLGFEGSKDHIAVYARPIPRIAEGQMLAPLVTAIMDISDGLLLDAQRMARASKVTMALEKACIPVAAPQRLEECLCWGDDYELLFTAPADTAIPLPATQIGRVEAQGTEPLLLDREAPSGLQSLGYEHG